MLIGVALQPVGWMFVQWLTIVSFVAIALGIFLLLAGRHDEIDDAPATSGRAMPGDIHGYSGQLSGGRSTAYESSHADHGGGAGD